MKKTLLKIIAAFTFVLTMIISLGTIKTYAASSDYSLSTYFTFSSDMDIDKGFELIKPYILYKNDNPCFEDYTFTADEENDGWYNYKGTFPDGNTFSYHTRIRIINDASGTYVESLNTKATRQSIYVTNLKEGKTTSDCLKECFLNRYINIKDPTYSIDKGSEPGSNIYNNMTSFTNGAGETKELQYYAIYDVKGTTTPINDEVIDIPDNPTTPDENIDNQNDEPNVPSDNPLENNTNQNKQNIESQSNNKMNPLNIALICIGAIIGIILIYQIYKLIRLLILWLKR